MFVSSVVLDIGRRDDHRRKKPAANAWFTTPTVTKFDTILTSSESPSFVGAVVS